MFSLFFFFFDPIRLLVRWQTASRASCLSHYANANIHIFFPQSFSHLPFTQHYMAPINCGIFFSLSSYFCGRGLSWAHYSIWIRSRIYNSFVVKFGIYNSSINGRIKALCRHRCCHCCRQIKSIQKRNERKIKYQKTQRTNYSHIFNVHFA